MLRDWKNAGLWGVEIYYYGGKPDAQKINERVGRVADKLGLGRTFGSDCHGPGTRNDNLGKFWGEFTGFS